MNERKRAFFLCRCCCLDLSFISVCGFLLTPLTAVLMHLWTLPDALCVSAFRTLFSSHFSLLVTLVDLFYPQPLPL